MNHRLVVLLLLLSAPAWASDFKYVGTLNASSGASTNNADVASTKADGTTGAIGAFTASAARPFKLALQCDTPVRLKTGSANTTAAANSGANKGPKLDVDQLFYFDLIVGYLAIIPASGSGSAACDVYQRL